MSQSTIIDIAQVARLSGVPASTLRYYEEKGLIQSTGRQGLRRLFSSKVLERLAIISLGQQAGFSLNEISTIFTPKGTHIDKNKLLAKAHELDRKIQKLTAIRNGLQHAAECPAPSHLECPSFNKLLRAASMDKLKKNKSVINK